MNNFKEQLEDVRVSSLEAKAFIENEIINNRCVKKMHFPNDVFYWQDLKSYYGTCAICHTTYKLNYEEVKK